jgi:hypothetical protein
VNQQPYKWLIELAVVLVVLAFVFLLIGFKNSLWIWLALGGVCAYVLGMLLGVQALWRGNKRD